MMKKKIFILAVLGIGLFIAKAFKELKTDVFGIDAYDD